MGGARRRLQSVAGVLALVRARLHERLDSVGYARSLGVSIGEECRLIDVHWGSEPYLVTLGDHVSATSTSFVTHDGGVWVFRSELPDQDLIAPITVGSNVFLGAGTMIMPGVSIGDNVVVGARSVVSRDLPSNCTAVGAPARPVRSLEEYRRDVEPRFLPTKLLSPAEKRAFLEDHFRSADRGPDV